MSWFIPAAHAADTPPQGADPIFSMVMFGGLFLFMYLLIIRPQRKRQKEHASLVSELAKGDEVVMTSGMIGRISKIEGEYMVLEVANNVELKFQRSSVHAVLPKGTIKAI